MSYVQINKEKREEYNQKAKIKEDKENSIAEDITKNVQGDTTADVRVDSFFSRKIININFSNKESFWSSDGVVRLEYNINDDSFRFNNSAGGTNDVSAEKIVDAYSDIYASAKNVIEDIKQNKLDYAERVNDIIDITSEMHQISIQIGTELKDDINNFLDSKLSVIGVKNNTEEDAKELLNKAEKEGSVTIFRLNDYNVTSALRDQANNHDDADVENSEFQFVKANLRCEVADNNAKRFYINDQFIKKGDIIDNLQNYMVDETPVTEILKNENKSKAKMSFKDLNSLAENTQKNKDLKELSDELNLNGKKKQDGRRKPSM